MRSRFHTTFVAATLAVLAIVFHATGLQAQLVVQSVSIANGAVDVPEVTDISVTFSEALTPAYDFSALQGILGSLPIDLNLIDPECSLPPAGIFVVPGGCPESVSLSEDRKTVTLHSVQLLPDMPHTLLVLSAQGEGGSSLAAPSVTRFSTGPSLPQGGIGGSVSSTGPTAVGTILLAVKAPLDLAGADSTLELNVAFADQDGNYAMEFVPDGSYFVIGLQLDIANPSDQEGLFVGTVDGNHDQIADKIDIAGEAVISGADVSITDQGATAAELNSPALNLLHMEAPAAQLALAAGAVLRLDGTALTWVYLYTSLAMGKAWAAASLGTFVFPPQILDLGENGDLLLGILASAAVPSDFGDSDGAVTGWLNAGGAEFLIDYEDAVGGAVLMSADLFAFIQLLLNSGDLSGFLSPVKKILTQLTAIPNLGRVVSKRTGEVWIMAAVAPLEAAVHLVAMDDAGNPLLVVGSAAARANQAAASAAATAWAADAVLVSVTTDFVPIDPRGSAAVWGFNYYAASKDSVISVVVSGGALGGVLAADVIAKEEVPSVTGLPDGWIDSPELIQAAGARAGAFIALHGDAVATASLSRGLQTGDTNRAIWRLYLTGTNSDGETESIVIDIDAETGVYVAVEDDRVQPTTFELGQNYPNPFNPSTSIPYRLAERGHVTLEVFDALGRRVATLVDAELPAGSYEAVWNARDTFAAPAPSGVYLYRLTTDATVKTLTMMLLK